MTGFIPQHGGYQKLITYRRAEIIYDATVYFTKRFLSRGDRTIDQMVQAARSGKQNIAEASMASGTSKESEIKLTNVARASQEELLIDYYDYMRNHKIPEWDRAHPYAIRMNDLIRNHPATYETFKKGIENKHAEICLNVIVGLIKVTQFLLARQIKTLEKDFVQHGGLRERMTRARLEGRKGLKGPWGQ
jgi:four helix bundle suffix protein